MQHDLNRLRIFFQVYSCGSASLAAKKLNLSQPAVSQHLQKLESELKVQLFTRSHKQLIPTGAGERLFTAIKPFLSALPATLQSLRQPLDSPYGLVRIGAPYDFGRAYLPEICHTFRIRYPHVTFNIRLGDSLTLIKFLDQGEIDFAIVDMVATDITPPGGKRELYSREPLIDEELILVASAAYYAERIAGDHSFATLINQAYISDEQNDTFLTHWFSHHFRQTKAHPEIVLTVESHQACLRCVELGMGLSTTSSHLVWPQIMAGSLVPITTTTPNILNTISLMQLLDKIPTITEKMFQEHVITTMDSDEMRRRFTPLPAAGE